MLKKKGGKPTKEQKVLLEIRAKFAREAHKMGFANADIADILGVHRSQITRILGIKKLKNLK